MKTIYQFTDSERHAPRCHTWQREFESDCLAVQAINENTIEVTCLDKFSGKPLVIYRSWSGHVLNWDGKGEFEKR